MEQSNQLSGHHHHDTSLQPKNHTPINNNNDYAYNNDNNNDDNVDDDDDDYLIQDESLVTKRPLNMEANDNNDDDHDDDHDDDNNDNNNNNHMTTISELDQVHENLKDLNEIQSFDPYNPLTQQQRPSLLDDDEVEYDDDNDDHSDHHSTMTDVYDRTKNEYVRRIRIIAEKSSEQYLEMEEHENDHHSNNDHDDDYEGNNNNNNNNEMTTFPLGYTDRLDRQTSMNHHHHETRYKNNQHHHQQQQQQQSSSSSPQFLGRHPLVGTTPPPRYVPPGQGLPVASRQQQQQQQTQYNYEEQPPIKTSSGLLLTHRKTTTPKTTARTFTPPTTTTTPNTTRRYSYRDHPIQDPLLLSSPYLDNTETTFSRQMPTDRHDPLQQPVSYTFTSPPPPPSQPKTTTSKTRTTNSTSSMYKKKMDDHYDVYDFSDNDDTNGGGDDDDEDHTIIFAPVHKYDRGSDKTNRFELETPIFLPPTQSSSSASSSSRRYYSQSSNNTSSNFLSKLFWNPNYQPPRRKDPNWTLLHHLGRTLSYIRMWVFVSALLLLSGTVVIVKHTLRDHHHQLHNDNSTNNRNTLNSDLEKSEWVINENKNIHNILHAKGIFLDPDHDSSGDTIEKVILLPLPIPDSNLYRTQSVRHGSGGGGFLHHGGKQRRLLQNYDDENHHDDHHQGMKSVILPTHEIGYDDQTNIVTNVHSDRNHHHVTDEENYPISDHHVRYTEKLRTEFHKWLQHHKKEYTNQEEHEHRFRVWSTNHHETMKKNMKHGPCKLTGQTVFGSNHFSDLTKEEFTSQYLTGYNGPRADEEPIDTLNSGVLGPHIPTTRHVSVHERYLQKFTSSSSSSAASTTTNYVPDSLQQSSSILSMCHWYDVTCLLQYIFQTYLYGMGGTMEPAYDADSYPTAIDWRELGAVSAVRSQGNCGACWAITAVETIESVVFISTGQMYQLSETEVIVCADSCEMCAGGWPQNAFEYSMKTNGVPLRSAMSYNADWLYKVSAVVAGESDEIDSSTLSSFLYATCPNSGNNGGSHDSGSKDNQQQEGNDDYYEGKYTLNNYARYGKIKGYGYGTKKCVCYTDGSGCDCASQNEGYAIRNLATYGPAVVCLDASTWQDYTSGIITPDSGCSSGFMDVNHCVQAVGYAFYEDGEGNGSHDNNQNSHSGDNNNNNGGSNDKSDRNGYWIIRNQWSTYWGMNGYAYVAMGSNTCGILNDMVQAYA